jgi:hypothetical protein
MRIITMSHRQDRIFGVLVLAFCVALLANAASAAPPASCVCKFVGEWSYPGGTTTVAANGLAYPKCYPCVKVQTWTCNGSTYLFSNAGPPGQFTATLIAPNKMQYSGGIATRTRAGACSAGAGEKKPQGTARCSTPAPGQTVRRDNQNCIQAKNTNSEPKCKYSFKYTSSINGKGLGGPVVNAGKTDTTVCARPGETLTFERWNQVPLSAQ